MQRVPLPKTKNYDFLQLPFLCCAVSMAERSGIPTAKHVGSGSIWTTAFCAAVIGRKQTALM